VVQGREADKRFKSPMLQLHKGEGFNLVFALHLHRGAPPLPSLRGDGWSWKKKLTHGVHDSTRQ
jgi:hypothetical protein